MHLASSMFLLAVFWDAQFIRWVVWVGLVVLTVALLLLMRTRWGQSQPLSKCVVLSLLAHLLLGIYMTTVTIVTETVGSPDGQGIQVALVASSGAGNVEGEPLVNEPWNHTSNLGAGERFGGADLSPVASLPALPQTAEPERDALAETQPAPLNLKPLEVPKKEDVGPPVLAGGDEPIAKPQSAKAAPIELPQSSEGENLDLVPPPEQPTSSETGDNAPKESQFGDGSGTSGAGKSANPQGDSKPSGQGKTATPEQLGGPSPGGSGSGTMSALPGIMQQRVGDHVSKGFGATQKSEAAVTSALAWLAANQRPSGRWEARALGGGAARAADGEERDSAGAQADAGITGLALLAFLAGGHTHLQGPHQSTVRRGLEFLLGVQDADGCLAGTTNRYERMYCHAMATCALSEAFAMTKDTRLQAAVRRAINYTLRSQDRVTGGWRYHASDPGDTSQLGWQLMALKSAELAGIPIPQETREGVRRFLKSVAAGRNGGLACYQASRPIATRSMTAEAMVCRQFMGHVDGPETLNEASGYLLQELPGTARTNHYYWYYATLGLYQIQGDAWRQWNEALQDNLLASQRHDGGAGGSWDPDPVWGGCGGRVYSTALATLCLEVYYRFLPLYVEAASRERRTK